MAKKHRTINPEQYQTMLNYLNNCINENRLILERKKYKQPKPKKNDPEMIPVDQRTEADKITASNLLTSLEFLKQEKNNLKNSYEINKMNWVVQQTQTLIKELSNTETREKISKLDLKVYSIDEILNLNKEGKNGN
jgi:hypothetical protein